MWSIRGSADVPGTAVHPPLTSTYSTIVPFPPLLDTAGDASSTSLRLYIAVSLTRQSDTGTKLDNVMSLLQVLFVLLVRSLPDNQAHHSRSSLLPVAHVLMIRASQSMELASADYRN